MNNAIWLFLCLFSFFEQIHALDLEKKSPGFVLENIALAKTFSFKNKNYTNFRVRMFADILYDKNPDYIAKFITLRKEIFPSTYLKSTASEYASFGKIHRYTKPTQHLTLLITAEETNSSGKRSKRLVCIKNFVTTNPITPESFVVVEIVNLVERKEGLDLIATVTSN